MRSGLAGTLFILSSCVTTPAPVQEAPPPSISIPLKIQSPQGSGPFPAIVILHDCSGLGPRSSGSPARWAKILLEQGYVVAIPDSFSTRGHAGGVCTNPSPSRNDVGPLRRAPDAYETLAYLRTLPYVDGKRIGVMGGSHGGASTLATLNLPKPDGFAAGIAIYPSCRYWVDRWKPTAPLLILIGELDDWTPAAPCTRLAEKASRAGLPVSIKVYPGAHHSFDSAAPMRFVAERVNENGVGGRGATTGGNAEAWADSVREVTQFFARHVKER